MVPEIEFYNQDSKYSAARVISGAVAYLLTLVGTKVAYGCYVFEQANLPWNLTKLPFGQDSDNFAKGDISFKGWHNFANDWSLQEHAAIFYAFLISDLGKTEQVQKLYLELYGKVSSEHDQTLAAVLTKVINAANADIGNMNAFKQMPMSFLTLLTFSEEQQALILQCCGHSNTNVALQRCEVPIQHAIAFGKAPSSVRRFNFLMEYLGYVTNIDFPEIGKQIMLTMHKQELTHIYLLWKNFYQAEEKLIKQYGNKDIIWDIAYQNYQADRLKLANINVDHLAANIYSILVLAIGVTETSNTTNANLILRGIFKLAKKDINTLAQERDTFAYEGSIYLSNIYSLVNNVIERCDNLEQGVQVGLSLVAYTYREARKAINTESDIGFNSKVVNVLDVTDIAERLPQDISSIADMLDDDISIEYAYFAVFRKSIEIFANKHGISLSNIPANVLHLASTAHLKQLMIKNNPIALTKDVAKGLFFGGVAGYLSEAARVAYFDVEQEPNAMDSKVIAGVTAGAVVGAGIALRNWYKRN